LQPEQRNLNSSCDLVIVVVGFEGLVGEIDLVLEWLMIDARESKRLLRYGDSLLFKEASNAWFLY
jgi:hypothetical protein